MTLPIIFPNNAQVVATKNGRDIETATDPAGRELLRVKPGIDVGGVHVNVTHVNLGAFLALLEALKLLDQLPKTQALPDCLPKPDDYLAVGRGTLTTPLWREDTVANFIQQLQQENDNG